MDLSRMCDRCFRFLSEEEQIHGFEIQDAKGNKRVMKGHEGCVEQMAEIISQLYGTQEESREKQEEVRHTETAVEIEPFEEKEEDYEV